MSDGLFQSDPTHKPRSSSAQPDNAPCARPLPDEGTAGSKENAPVDFSGESENESAGCSPSPSDTEVDQGAGNRPIATPEEAGVLGGLGEDQPHHRPAVTAPPRSPQVPSGYVPPSQTEAPTSFQLIGRLYSVVTGPTAVALAVGIGGLLALYVYFQVLSLVTTLATLPGWLAFIAIILLGLLIAAVALAFGRLVVGYVRLRRNRQVRMSDIERLDRHAQIRRDCSPTQQRQQAKATLEVYVREYPEYNVPKSSHPEAPEGCPFSVEQLRQLQHVRRRLADPTRVRDTKQWLQVYTEEFQNVLDDTARDRVHWCSKWVGFKTAISPHALVDTLITAYWCFVMLRDLCVIYNVRVGAYGTAALLWRAFFSAYLAGKLQDWEEHAEETVESMLDGLPELAQSLTAKFTAKAGTGLANYFIVRRLGKRAIALLRPLVS